MADSLNINESLSPATQAPGQARAAANRPDLPDQANGNARSGGSGQGAGRARALGQGIRGVVVEISQEAVDAQASAGTNAATPTRQTLGQSINTAVATLQSPAASGGGASAVVEFPVGLGTTPANGGTAATATTTPIGITAQLGSLSDDDAPVRAASFDSGTLGGADSGGIGQNLVSRIAANQTIGINSNDDGGGSQLGAGANTPDFGPLSRVQDQLSQPAGDTGSINQIGGNDQASNNFSTGNDNNQISINADDGGNEPSPLASAQARLSEPSGTTNFANQIGGNNLAENNDAIGNNNQISINNDDAENEASPLARAQEALARPAADTGANDTNQIRTADAGNEFGPLARVQDQASNPGAATGDDGPTAELTRARPVDQIEISALRFNTQRPGGQSVAGIAQSPGQAATGGVDFRTNLAVPAEGGASNTGIGAEEPGPQNGIANDFTATGQSAPIVAEAVAEPAAGIGPGTTPEATFPRTVDSPEPVPQPENSPQADAQAALATFESENDRTPFDASDPGALAGGTAGNALLQAADAATAVRTDNEDDQVTAEAEATAASDVADDAINVSSPAAVIADNIERAPTTRPELIPANQVPGEGTTLAADEPAGATEGLGEPAEAEQFIGNAQVGPAAEPAQPAEREAAVAEAPPAAAAPEPTPPGALAEEGTAEGNAAAETRTDTAFEAQQTENRTPEPIEPRNPIDLFVR